MFSGLYKKIRLKENEVWREVISDKIIVTLVTQCLPSSFLSRKFSNIKSENVGLYVESISTPFVACQDT